MFGDFLQFKSDPFLRHIPVCLHIWVPPSPILVAFVCSLLFGFDRGFCCLTKWANSIISNIFQVFKHCAIQFHLFLAMLVQFCRTLSWVCVAISLLGMWERWGIWEVLLSRRYWYLERIPEFWGKFFSPFLSIKTHNIFWKLASFLGNKHFPPVLHKCTFHRIHSKPN